MSAIDAALRNLSTLAGLPRFATQAVVRVQAGEPTAPIASDTPDGGEDASEPTAQDRVSIMPGIEWAREADPERFDAMTWAQRGEWCDTAQRAVRDALDRLQAVQTREPPSSRAALWAREVLREDVFAGADRQPVIAAHRLADGTIAQVLAFDLVLYAVVRRWGKRDAPYAPDTETTLEQFYARQAHEERFEKWSSGRACVGIMRFALEHLEDREAEAREAEHKRAKAEREQIARDVQTQLARHERGRFLLPTLHTAVGPVVLAMAGNRDTARTQRLPAGMMRCPDGWLPMNAPEGAVRTVGVSAGILAAHLARESHRAYMSGASDAASSLVHVDASHKGLAALGLGEHPRPVEHLAEALDLLRRTSLVNHEGGEGWMVTFVQPRQHSAGGRPSTVFDVGVGWPLMPAKMEALLAQRFGANVPRELRWYAPVLSAAHAPVTGYSKTHKLQRLAYSVGIGQWAVENRLELLDNGGWRLDTLAKALRELGMYDRTHKSLVDDTIAEWCKAPAQRALPSIDETPAPMSPLLVPVSHPTDSRVTLYALGDDYEEITRYILGTAGLSKRRSEAAQARNDKRKPKPPKVTRRS